MARNAAEKRQWYDGRLGLHCILTFLCFTKEPIGRSFTSSKTFLAGRLERMVRQAWATTDRRCHSPVSRPAWFACRLLLRLDIWTIWWGTIHLFSTT